MRAKFAVALAAVLASATGLAGGAGIAAAQGSMKIGVEIPLSIVNVPLLITVDRLKEAGHDIELVQFQSPETMSLALQKGEIDVVGGVSAGTAFQAIDAGFEGKIFLGLVDSDFQMIARSQYKTCESLDGKRVAIHSREGTSGSLTINWFEKDCPNIKPSMTIVPGSENRVAGLLANQIDASAIDSQNAALLMKERPGEFAIIGKFAETIRLLASVFYGRADYLSDHADTLRTFTETYVAVINEGYANPDLFYGRLTELLPDLDKDMLRDVLDSWIARKVWVPVSGASPDRIQDAIGFYSRRSQYEKIETAADVSTDEFVAGL